MPLPKSLLIVARAVSRIVVDTNALLVVKTEPHIRCIFPDALKACIVRLVEVTSAGASCGVRLAAYRALLTLLLLAPLTKGVTAQTVPFDIKDVLQAATVDNPLDILSSGTLTMQGIKIVVPRNTLVLLPGRSLTWLQLFTLAPAPYGIPGNPGVTATVPETGLAPTDTNGTPPPLNSYTVHVVGNIVNGTYIAGLISLSGSPDFSGQGVINSINYATGELLVGPSNVRVQLNDPALPGTTPPTGRYGLAATLLNVAPPSADVRFQADQDNPTIRSKTGYPMCIPRTDPATADDSLCPQLNRPKGQAPLTSGGVYSAVFTTSDPTQPIPTGAPDPFHQAPFEIGDSITYAGTLVRDAGGTTGPTVGPPGIANTHISAHTIINDTAIFTFPGTAPAYLAIDHAQFGVGTTVGEIIDASAVTEFEGYTTDSSSSNNVPLFAIEINPLNGATTDRFLGTAAVDSGVTNSSLRGHWLFQPPNELLASILTISPSLGGGTFLPATREVRAALGIGVPPSAFTLLPSVVAANGLLSGQYRRANEYVFPGSAGPLPQPNDFTKVQDLCAGSGPLFTAGNPIIGPLSPWPGSADPPICGWTSPPVANAGPDQSVPSQSNVTLDGRASVARPPFHLLWTAPTGITLSDTTSANPTFLAPRVPFGTAPQPLAFTLQVTDAAGASTTDSITVFVDPEQDVTPPTINIGSPKGTYILNQSGVNASYSCVDAQSGVASCIGSLNGTVVASGAPISTATPGTFVFSVNAADVAGNASSSTSTYTVGYEPAGTLCLGEPGHQILQPINADGTSVFKQKSTVSAKFRVCDANGASIGTPGVVASFFLVRTISGTVVMNVDEAVDSTTPDPNFRWDPTAQQWIFNLNTKGLAAGITYVFQITLNDGSSIFFQFGLR